MAETLATSLSPERGDLPAELLDEELPATEVEGDVAGVKGGEVGEGRFEWIF